MKNLILIVFLLSVSLTAFGQASPGAIFSGSYIKMLKKNIIMKDSDVVILTGDSDDPSAVAKTGAKGSLYVRSTNGVWYQKQDNGSSTNWTRLYFVAPLTASRAMVTDGSGLPSASTTTSTQIGYLDSLTAANGGLVYSDADSLVVGTVGTSGQPLLSGGAGAYSWFSSSGVVKATSGVLSTSNVDLTSEVTGILPVSNGGTGASTLTLNNVVLGNGTSAVQFVAPGTSGNVLTSNGTTWSSTAPVSTTITIGTIDSQSKSANGAVASGTTFYQQTADATYPGLVSTGTQTIAGNKTLSGTTNLSALTASRPLKLDGSKNITSTQIDLASTNDVTGVLDETNGGTGQSTITTGDTLYGSASNTLSKLAIGTTGQYKKVVSGIPSWQEPEFDIYNLYQEDFEGAVVAASLSTGDASSPMGGGSISGTVTDETTSFINGTGAGTTGKSIKYVEAAGSQNDYICGPEIDLGTSVNRREKNNYLGFSTRYLLNANSGEIKAGIYDVTNATFLADGTHTLNAASVPTPFSTASYIPSTTQKVRWCFHVLTANSGKILYFDDIVLSSRPYQYGNFVDVVKPATYMGNPSISVANSTTTYIDYGTKVFDDDNLVTGAGGGSVTTTNTGWKYVAKKKRKVSVATNIQFGGTTAWDAGETTTVSIKVNNVEKLGKRCEAQGTGIADFEHECFLSGDVSLEIGDRIEVTVFQNSGSTRALDASWTYISINDAEPQTTENIVTPANSPRETSLTVTGTSWTTTRAVGVYYRTADGAHRLNFNIRGSRTTGSSISQYTITISGVTFKNVANFNQPVSLSASNLTSDRDVGYAITNTGASTITAWFASNDPSSFGFSGDVELDSKPTWADDVHTNFLAAVPANIVTSPESTHTQPKVCSYRITMSTDVADRHYGSCLNSTSCSNTATGITTCNFKQGYWTAIPNCSATAFLTTNGIVGTIDSVSTSDVAYRSQVAGVDTAGTGFVMCHGY